MFLAIQQTKLPTYLVSRRSKYFPANITSDTCNLRSSLKGRKIFNNRKFSVMMLWKTKHYVLAGQQSTLLFLASIT